MRLSTVNKQQEIYTFIMIQKVQNTATTYSFSNSLGAFDLIHYIASKVSEKSHTFLLAYFLTCLVACLPTHLFAYTDDRVMLLSFITGLSPQIIKNTKSYYFFPNIMQQCFFFGQVCFSFLMSLLKKLGCLGVISLFIPHFFLNRKALFPRMK